MAPSSDANAGKPPAGRRSLRRAVVVLAVLSLVLAGVAGFFGYEYYRHQQLEDLRTSALDAATQYTVDLATYDYEQPNANLDTVVAQSTSEFGAKYRGVASDLQSILAEGKGTAKGAVRYAGLVSLDDEKTVVAVFLDQEVHNVMVPEGRTDASRMVITLVRSDDRWLLDGADAK